MTTLALLGLLVVLLVAIGIATFLLRGRKRAESGVTDEQGGPPRTVRDLVDRRRDGDEPGPATPDPAEPDATADRADAGTEPTAQVEQVEQVEGASAEGQQAATAGAAADDDAEPDDTVQDDTGQDDAEQAATPETSPKGTARHQRLPVAAAGTDVDSGPVDPPWARGFVDGRPIEPPEAADTAPVETVADRPAAPQRAESRSPVDPDLVKRVTAVPDERSTAPRTTSPDTEREFREARDRIISQPAAGRVPEQAGPSSTAPRRPSPVPVPDRERAEEPRREPDTESTGTGTRVGVAAVGAAAVGTAAAGVAGMSAGASNRDPETTGEQDPSPSSETVTPSAGPVSDGPPQAGARPSPSPRPAGGPQVGPDGEPAPRPSPRLMRSTAPADDPDLAPVPADEEQAGTGAGQEPAGATAGPEPVGDTAGPEPVGDTAEQEPAVPERGADEDAEPVVAFTSPRGPEPGSEPVPGTDAQDVRVEVVGRDGTLLPGATVVLRDGTGAEIGTGTTDRTGVAVLQAPGAGRYVVVASSQEHQPGVATCSVDDRQGEVTITLTRPAAVHGVVRSAAGSPMAGVQITLDQDGDPVARTDSGADGAFRISDLGAGYYRLLAGTGAGAASSALRLAAEADVEQDLQVTGG